MYCNKCGALLNDEASFCPQCGGRTTATIPYAEIAGDTQEIENSSKPQERKHIKKHSGMKKMIFGACMALLLIVAVVFGRLIPMPGIEHMLDHKENVTIEGAGYSSPDAAALAFAQAYSEKDIDGMFSACALESYVKNRGFKKELERYGEWTDYESSLVMTGKDEASARCNLERKKGKLYDLFYRMFFYPSFEKDSDFLRGRVKIGDAVDQKSVDEVLISLDLFQKLKDITVGDVLDPMVLEFFRTHEYKDKVFETIEQLNGGKIEYRMVEMNINGEEWLMLMDLINYEDKWYVLTPGGSFAALLGLGSDAAGMVRKQDIM
ncbi:MAG: zinc-ribbon domain-containing protein [Lachnospiraceae bacterium]|nr:zinc-ribbon domain-containing protein [Lachnospiraceae bacterium]